MKFLFKLLPKKERKEISYGNICVQGKTFGVTIELLPKRNSSGTWKNGNIMLRLSNKLSEKKLKEHIDVLLKKITKRIEKHSYEPWNPLLHLFTSPFLQKTVGEDDIYSGELELNNETKYSVYLKKNIKQNISAKIVPKNRIVISIPDIKTLQQKKETIIKLIYKLIAKDQLNFIYDFVNFLNQQYFQKNIHSVSLKYMNSRWGSCSKRGDINLSVKLLFIPLELMEYVCIHELAHLFEMNHSKKFWNIVEKILPDYREKRKMLKKYSV